MTHSLSYTHLTELRVDARPGRASRLVAIGAAARRWEMGLAGADIARLQAVLDVVDGRLADPPRQGPRTLDLNIQKTAVLMAAAMVLVLSQVTVAFVAFLAWVKPSLPLLAGAGLAALTAAGLVLRDRQQRVPDGDVAPDCRHRPRAARLCMGAPSRRSPGTCRRSSPSSRFPPPRPRSP